MKKISLYLILAAFLVSCGSKKITEQQRSFPDKIWQNDQNLVYEFPITDTSATYDISAVVKHFDNFPFDRVKLSFTLADPSGENRISEHDLVLRDKAGKFLGKKRGDTIVMDFRIRNRYKFRVAGQAKVTLVNRLYSSTAAGIGGISIVVRKKN
jgi:gliding motility-associated lipoprotein GldH